MTGADRLHERCACTNRGAGSFTLAGTERKYERSRPFLIRHTALDLFLDMPGKAVQGRATLELARVAPDATSIELDAIGFEIHGVRLLRDNQAEPATFEYDGEQLRVLSLPNQSTLKLEIAYRATPRRGLYFLAPDAQVKDRPEQVWSQCQDEDARHWFPCHDKPHIKMTTELRVDVPKGLVALSNGDPVDAPAPSDPTRSTFQFRLTKPHPSYLVTLVVGKFAVETDRDATLPDGRSVPVRYYVPPDRGADAQRSFGETPRMIELFSKLTGVAYPWSRYSQVVVSDFVFGGMENTTATTLYEHALLDARAAIDATTNDLVAHELAHQWFGDFVTCRDWSHAWLNEGFATYFEHLEREDRLGRDEYDYGVRTDLGSYLSEVSGRYQRPIVCRDYHEPIDLFDRHLYEKGGLVLHMLRRELGDELFFAAVRLYLERHAHGLVETLDLQRAFEEVSGKSFERFFDQWVFRAGHPDLKVKIAYEDSQVVVSVRQQQKAPEVSIFECDFEIEIAISQSQIVRHKKRMTGSQDVLVVPLERRPAYVAFDPEMRVLGSLQVEAPGDFQRKQLEHGSSAYLRLSAAEGLGKRADPESIAALARCLANIEEPWMVRAEAARALGRTRAEAAFERLREQVHVQHPKVRRSVATALGNFRSQAALEALRPLADHDDSYLVEAEAARALGRTRQKGALSPLLSLLQRDSWSDVVRSGALDGLATLRDEEGLAAVTERTRYGHPTRGRRTAILALAELGEGKRTREKLEQLLDDPDPHVRSDVVSALLRFGDPRCRAALRRALDQELDGRVLRRIREALRDLGETNTERKRVADELEGLRGEVGELKARLAKLEAKAPAPKPPAKGKPVAPAKRPSKTPPKATKPSKRPAPPRSKRRT